MSQVPSMLAPSWSLPGRMSNELAQNAAQTLGPYRLVELVGQGGMGRVFRAEHMQSGQRVALKTIHGSGRLSSLRREIRALSRLRHPGIVRIVDQGVSRGQPWYAMELLEGRTLAQELALAHRPTSQPPASAPTTMASETGLLLDDVRPAARPAPRPTDSPATPARDIAPFLAIVRGLCAPLALLHGHGIVHRDLKPGNIIICPGSVPVIVDLGIASRFGGAQGREDLTATGDRAGTCAYMAPEQIRGEYVDARADLYSLGCILYQCVTGQTPFIGDRKSIMLAHLHAAPRRPSQLIDGVPAALGSLIASLLAKEPRDRLGYAGDVDRALAELGVEPVAWPEQPSRSRPYLYRPRMAGRVGLVDELTRRIARAAAGERGACIFIGGESGVGKTRLALELARIAAGRSMQVITGQCQSLTVEPATEPAEIDQHEPVRGAPLHPFRPLLLAIADRCRALGPEEAGRLLGPRGKLLAPYEPGLADLAHATEHPAPVPLPAPQARTRLFRAMHTTLRALAEARPVLLILDDLQWADELSIELVRFLADDRLSESGVVLIGTYRLEEITEDLRTLTAAQEQPALELKRLDHESVEQIVSDMLALRQPPPRAFIEFLTSTSSGNPFFLAEYMREAIDRGLIHRDPRGAWRFQDVHSPLDSAVPLPQTLAQLIDQRLARLDEPGEALIHAAAVIGRSFDSELLAQLTGAGESAFMDGLQTLRTRQILEEDDSGGLRFVHDKIREIAYSQIAAARLPRLHNRAAETIERAYPGDPTTYQSLGHHWSTAGARDKAASYYARAGDHARETYANRDAITMYRAAVSHIDQSAAREQIAQLHEQIGDLLSLGGDKSRARGAFSESMAKRIAADSHDQRLARARLYRKIAKSWEVQHRHDNASSAYGAAAYALGDPPRGDSPDWWHEWIRLHLDRIVLHYWTDEIQAMERLIARVEPVLEERSTPLQRSRFYHRLVALRTREERFLVSAETAKLSRKALHWALESGDVMQIADMRFDLATSSMLHDDLESAEEQITLALQEAERIGHITLVSRCMTYAAVIYRRLGRVDETEAMANRALAVARETRMKPYIGTARANLGWVAWRNGDMASAREHVDAAIEIWDGLAPAFVYPLQWPARLLAMRLDLEAGNLAQAAVHVEMLLDQTQPRLPKALTHVLGECSLAWGDGLHDRVGQLLLKASQTALGSRYL